jgi:hypothetical protein
MFSARSGCTENKRANVCQVSADRWHNPRIFRNIDREAAISAMAGRKQASKRRNSDEDDDDEFINDEGSSSETSGSDAEASRSPAPAPVKKKKTTAKPTPKPKPKPKASKRPAGGDSDGDEEKPGGGKQLKGRHVKRDKQGLVRLTVALTGARQGDTLQGLEGEKDSEGVVLEVVEGQIPAIAAICSQVEPEDLLKAYEKTFSVSRALAENMIRDRVVSDPSTDNARALGSGVKGAGEGGVGEAR